MRREKGCHLGLTSVAAALVVCSLAATATAKPETKPAEPQTVGVTVALAVELDDIARALLEVKLGEALSERFDVKIVAGDAARRRLPFEGLPETCIAEDPCLARVAKALGVSRLLMLVAVRVGEDIQVDATLYDAATKKSENLPSIRMKSEASRWKEAFVSNADRLLPGAPPRKIPKPIEAGGIPVPHTAAIAVFGLGVVSAGVAGAYGFSAFFASDNDTRGCFKGSACLRRAKRADLIGGIAAGLGVIGIVLAFALPTQTRSIERSVRLESGPGDVGFAIGGSF